jgi:hypothetical protein
MVQRIVVGDEKMSAHAALRAYEGRTVILGVRPEDLEDAGLLPDTLPDRRLRAECGRHRTVNVKGT